MCKPKGDPLAIIDPNDHSDLSPEAQMSMKQSIKLDLYHALLVKPNALIQKNKKTEAAIMAMVPMKNVKAT
jgi:hypothetical protein